MICHRALILSSAIALLAACGSTKTGTTTSAIVCHVDNDCPSPTVCQTCNARCVFAPNAACNLDEAPCPCGYSCRNQQCANDGSAMPATCTYNTDCPVDEFCNHAQFVCEYPMELGQSTGMACTSNADCTQDDVCSTAGGSNAGECAPDLTKECHTAADCDAGYYCSPQGQCDHMSC